MNRHGKQCHAIGVRLGNPLFAEGGSVEQSELAASWQVTVDPGWHDVRAQSLRRSHGQRIEGMSQRLGHESIAAEGLDLAQHMRRLAALAKSKPSAAIDSWPRR